MRPTAFDQLRFVSGQISLLMGLLLAGGGLAGLSLSDWHDLYYYVSPVATVPGQVLARQPTSYLVDDYPVWEVTFRYQPAGQLPRLGRSYSTDTLLQAGQAVTTEYCVRLPTLARVAGGSSTPFGGWGLLVGLVFVAAGGAMTYRSGRHAWRQLAVLRDAALTRAVFQRTEAIQPRNDDSENYLLHYAYQAAGQAHTHTLETSHPDRYRGRELLAYQQARPANSVLLATLPAYLQRRLTVPA